jgi:hypothetical protein
VRKVALKIRTRGRYRSLWEMLQGPVRETVQSRRLADLEIPDGFLNLIRVG